MSVTQNKTQNGCNKSFNNKTFACFCLLNSCDVILRHPLSASLILFHVVITKWVQAPAPSNHVRFARRTKNIEHSKILKRHFVWKCFLKKWFWILQRCEPLCPKRELDNQKRVESETWQPTSYSHMSQQGTPPHKNSGYPNRGTSPQIPLLSS